MQRCNIVLQKFVLIVNYRNTVERNIKILEKKQTKIHNLQHSILGIE